MPINWKKTLDTIGKVADAITQGSGIQRDAALLKAAGMNLLLAAGFPVPVGLRAWQGKSGTWLERASRVLEEPAVREWLVLWAEMPRPMRAKPRGLQ
jgi:hypothetical protein